MNEIKYWFGFDVGGRHARGGLALRARGEGGRHLRTKGGRHTIDYLWNHQHEWVVAYLVELDAALQETLKVSRKLSIRK